MKKSPANITTQQLANPQPQNLYQQYETQQWQIIPQQCLFHQNNPITNMCVDHQCLFPLCPNCIPLHIQEHVQRGTQPQIDSIQNVRSQSIQSIEKDLQVISNQYDSISNLHTQKNNLSIQLNEQLQIAQQKVLLVVSQFFEQIAMELQNLTRQTEQSWDQLKGTEIYLQSKQKELNDLLQKLNGSKYLKTLIKTSTPEYINNNQNYLIECQHQMDTLQKKSLKLELDESKLYTLSIELAKYVLIQNVQGLKSKQNRSQESYKINQMSSLKTDQNFVQIHQKNIQSNQSYLSPQYQQMSVQQQTQNRNPSQQRFHSQKQDSQIFNQPINFGVAQRQPTQELKSIDPDQTPYQYNDNKYQRESRPSQNYRPQSQLNNVKYQDNNIQQFNSNSEVLQVRETSPQYHQPYARYNSQQGVQVSSRRSVNKPYI